MLFIIFLLKCVTAVETLFYQTVALPDKNLWEGKIKKFSHFVAGLHTAHDVFLCLQIICIISICRFVDYIFPFPP